MTKDEICAKLDELGIAYDKRQGADKLAALLPGEETPSVPTIACTVLRDFWDAAEVRHPKGGVVYVAAEAAMDGVEAGTLSRRK